MYFSYASSESPRRRLEVRERDGRDVLGCECLELLRPEVEREGEFDLVEVSVGEHVDFERDEPGCSCGVTDGEVCSKGREPLDTLSSPASEPSHPSPLRACADDDVSYETSSHGQAVCRASRCRSAPLSPLCLAPTVEKL